MCFSRNTKKNEHTRAHGHIIKNVLRFNLKLMIEMYVSFLFLFNNLTPNY